ncbi:MAG: polyphosphate kinase 2 family protein [Clostridia bacterium]|nr:MAG: polyphosphate kinase 2 family protein [Clostridia bacterium]
MSSPAHTSFCDQYGVPVDAKLDLSAIDPNDTGRFTRQKEASKALKKLRKELRALQDRFYAWNQKSLLIVLQAMDTGGKDGVIKHVMRGVNPQGVHVASFKAPTPEELAHDYLWRVHKVTPKKGQIGIFNRSHYEDVLVVRVHNLVPEAKWSQRYEQINQFEEHLAENDTIILKFYLHISKDEQARRLQARLDDPNKRWKFSKGDLKERQYWDEYMQAYTDALQKCSTPHAPWYVIPANHKWYRNYVIAKIIIETLNNINPQYPAEEEGLEDIVIT